MYTLEDVIQLLAVEMYMISCMFACIACFSAAQFMTLMQNNYMEDQSSDTINKTAHPKHEEEE